MKKFILLIFFFSNLIIAQSYHSQNKLKPDTTNKFIVIEYDKFFDTYTYSLKNWIWLADVGYGDEWQYNLVFDINAYKIGKSKAIQFDPYFFGRSKKIRYNEWDKIYLLVDGKRIILDITEHENKTYAENLFSEKLLVDINKKDFIKIAQAKVVEGRVGIYEFHWSYNKREALREMIKLVYEK